MRNRARKAPISFSVARFAPWLVVLLAALSSFAARAQQSPAGDHLRVTHSWGLVASYDIVTSGPVRYLAQESLGKILHQVDRRAQEAWDAASGTYHVSASGRDISLFRGRREFVFNQEIVEADDDALELDGALLIPVETVRRILSAFEGVQTELVIARPTPVPEPTAVPTQAPSGLDPLSEDISFIPELDVRDIIESLRLLGAGETDDARALGREMRWAAKRLTGRNVIVLDPPMAPVPGGHGLADTEALIRIARRCRDLLVERTKLEVVLSHEAGDDPSKRRRALERDDLLALICLRVDASRFPGNAGFRVFIAHEATDPAALRMRGQNPDPTMLPPSLRYQPYQEASLALARLLEMRLAESGADAAPERLRLAPVYSLRRAETASTMAVLGYWSNTADRERLSSNEGVENTARALARTIMQFTLWVQANGGGAP